MRTLYLDVIHELFHVKQRTEDSEYFHREHMKFMRDRPLYYVSPIEVPAYKHTAQEARRTGMSYDEIVEYLKTGPVPPKIFARFLKKMEIKPEKTKSPRSRPADVGLASRSLSKYRFEAWSPKGRLLELSAQLSFEEDVTIYDACYVALAQRMGSRVITEDAELLTKFPELTTPMNKFGEVSS